MAKVIAPNSQYTGLSATVAFVNGVGETDNENLLQWFEEKGYTVIRPEPEADLPPAGDPSGEVPSGEPEVPEPPAPEVQPEPEPEKSSRKGK